MPLSAADASFEMRSPLRAEHVRNCRGTRNNALLAEQALSLIFASYITRLSCLTSSLVVVGGVQKCCSPATRYAEPGLRAGLTDQRVNIHRVAWLQGKTHDEARLRAANVYTKQSCCVASGDYAPRPDSGIYHAGPNTVIRSGQGPQFASAAGPGSQTAVSNSGPGAQQTSIGQNSFPSPNNIFGTGTGLAVYPSPTVTLYRRRSQSHRTSCSSNAERND